MDAIIQAIIAEVQRANGKWGESDLPITLWITVLMEEVGEVARAELDGDIDGYREELTHVAAVCIRALLAEERRRTGEPATLLLPGIE